MTISTDSLIIFCLLVAVCITSAKSSGYSDQNVTSTTNNSPNISDPYETTYEENINPTMKENSSYAEVEIEVEDFYPTIWYNRPSLIVDLSYPFNENSIALDGHTPFKYVVEHDGYSLNQFNKSYYWKMDSFSTGIHTGTHMDAPLHFYQDRWSIDKVPLTRLLGIPVTVVDLSDSVRKDRAYEFKAADFWKLRIPARSVVLVYTGISDDYKLGLRSYYGMRQADTDKSHIPGFSALAARYLVSRGVYGVGLDAPSADSSNNVSPEGHMNHVAHKTFCSNNVFILENLNPNLKYLRSGSKKLRLFALPLAITGASGSPVRVIIVREPEINKLTSSTGALQGNYLLMMTTALLAWISICMSGKTRV